MSAESDVRVEDVHLQSDTGEGVQSGEVTVTVTTENIEMKQGTNDKVETGNITDESASIVDKKEGTNTGKENQVTTGVENGDVTIESVVETQSNDKMKGPAKLSFTRSLEDAESHLTTDRHKAVKLRVGKNPSEFTGIPAVTVMEEFEGIVEKYPEVAALKVERNETWISWTYAQYKEEVRAAAKGFIKLGLNPTSSVGIIGFNAPEWAMSCLAAIYAGGLSCGIYTTNSPEACLFVGTDAKLELLVAENQTYADKFIQNWDKLPDLKAIILYTGEVIEKGKNIYTWNEVIEMGRNETDEVLVERTKDQAPNRCCCLIYTSGTTGNPKGVMLSHDNLVFGAKLALKAMEDVVVIGGHEHIISYLPLSHIAAMMIDIFCTCCIAGTIWFARPDALKGTLSKTLKTVRPTLFFGVPRVYEKIEDSIKAAGRNVTGFRRKLADWAKSVALRGNINKEQGRSVPYGWTIANSLILKKVKNVLGFDRCRMAVTGAAPVQLETLRYFQSLNIPLYELYGMSECGCSNLSLPNALKTSAVGRPCPGFEMMIANKDEDGSGEVCMRGRGVFMGYLNNEEKTNETLDEEGWLHSGDVGKLDDDGFLYITGRIKELIITAGAENIAPVPIEDCIKAELPIISNAMVVGDRKKFLSVLLTVKTQMDVETGAPLDELLPVSVGFCDQIGVKAAKASDITREVPEALSKAIQEGIDKANEHAISRAARVQKWKFLDYDFSIPGGELGPTLKVRRPQVSKKYKELIDAFYE